MPLIKWTEGQTQDSYITFAEVKINDETSVQNNH